MSIMQLQADLKELMGRLLAEPPATTPALVLWLQDNLLPWLQSQSEELGEMDEAIESIIHDSVDVLHPESGAVFAGIITSGLAIATELAARAGNDQRILTVVKEFRVLAVQGKEILEEIVLDDEDDEDDEDEDEEEDDEAPAPANNGGVPEGKGA
jgi:hypothetical protein